MSKTWRSPQSWCAAGLFGVTVVVLGGRGLGSSGEEPGAFTSSCEITAPLASMDILDPNILDSNTVLDEPAYGFVLAQASFDSSNTPRPSQMTLLRRGEDGAWSARAVTDEGGGNVFHKAMWFEPKEGRPGILTVSANPAFVKIWREDGEDWSTETLWEGSVGVKQQRLRDVEIGDVTGDGVEDIVIVTHDRGVVMVIEQKEGKYLAARIADCQLPEEERQWIHECELADIDGDGVMEIFCTPSAPNSFDAEQPGYVKMYDREGDGWKEVVVDELHSRHAKEILACDFFGDGKVVLFAALEGGTGASSDKSGGVRMYRWTGERFMQEDVIDLPGKLTRFLACGDTNGDGKNELIAATMSSGIVEVSYDAEADAWSRTQVASSLVSSSFEHAICLRDLDGDGAAEIVVASDKQKRVQSFSWDPERGKYERSKLVNLTGYTFLTFNMTPLGEE